MVKTYRAAIVGLSTIGAAPPPAALTRAANWPIWPHSHVAAHSSLPNVEVVAACDLKPELLEREVFAERGRMRVGNQAAEIWFTPPGADAEARMAVPVPLYQRADTPAAIAEIIDAIERGGTVSSPPAAARTTLAVLLAILQSQAAGGAPVRFPIADA
jgi:predicted dehydrogenase